MTGYPQTVYTYLCPGGHYFDAPGDRDSETAACPKCDRPGERQPYSGLVATHTESGGKSYPGKPMKGDE